MYYVLLLSFAIGKIVIFIIIVIKQYLYKNYNLYIYNYIHKNSKEEKSVSYTKQIETKRSIREIIIKDQTINCDSFVFWATWVLRNFQLGLHWWTNDTELSIKVDGTAHKRFDKMYKGQSNSFFMCSQPYT